MKLGFAFIGIIFIVLSGFQSYNMNNSLDEKSLSIDLAVNEAYQKIINEYKNALSLGADYVLNNQKEFSHVNMDVILYAREDTNQSICYAKYDIDKNGIDELILIDTAWIGTNIIDIYSFDGKSAFQLFENVKDNLGTLTHLKTYENGILYIYGSRGWGYGFANFYKIDEDGYHLTLIEEYSFDDYNHFYFNENESLSSKEFDKKVSDFIEVTNYPLFHLNVSLTEK